MNNENYLNQKDTKRDRRGKRSHALTSLSVDGKDLLPMSNQVPAFENLGTWVKSPHLFRMGECVAQLHKRLAYWWKEVQSVLAKCTFKKKIWRLSGSDLFQLTFFFFLNSFLREWKAMRGRGWKLCTHSAGSVTWGPGSSHHSCSTPTYGHRARNINYSSQLQYEQTLANFSAMCHCNQRGSSVSTAFYNFTLNVY